MAMVSGAGDDKNDKERQQRELEELGRSFQEVGIKVGSFEPAQPNGDSAGQRALPAPATAAQPPTKGRPTWVLALAAVACLLLGGGFGYLLHRPTAPTITWPTATSVVTRTPPVRVVAPPACLQTAQRGAE